MNQENNVMSNEKYRIIAVEDNYHETGKIFVKVQILGSSKLFSRPVSDLYQKEWLEYFSKEDVAHIAALYTAEHTQNLALIKKFPKKNPSIKGTTLIIAVLFTTLLILSNLTAFKLAEIGSIAFPAGLIFFSSVYILDNLLTEVYGYKISRYVIWLALLANIIVFLGILLTIYLKPSAYWHQQLAYNIVYQATPKIFLASMIGYLLGEFINSYLLAKMKILTQGRYLAIRAVSSNAIAMFIDTVLFIHIAFFWVLPYLVIWKIIITIYLFKLIFIVCTIPMTCKLAGYLKRRDDSDHYDFQTRFNPFSLDL